MNVHFITFLFVVQFRGACYPGRARVVSSSGNAPLTEFFFDANLIPMSAVTFGSYSVDLNVLSLFCLETESSERVGMLHFHKISRVLRL